MGKPKTLHCWTHADTAFTTLFVVVSVVIVMIVQIAYGYACFLLVGILGAIMFTLGNVIGDGGTGAVATNEKVPPAEQDWYTAIAPRRHNRSEKAMNDPYRSS